MRFYFDYNDKSLDGLKKKQKYEKYRIWAEALWDAGMQYPLYKIKDDLNVSMNWINTILMPNINTVKYDTVFLIHKLGDDRESRSSIYCNKQDIVEWIKANATFERQTIVKDFLVEYGITAKEYESLMQEIHEKTKMITYHNHIKNGPTIVKDAALNGNSKRSEHPWISISPVDIYDYDIVPANSYYSHFNSTEQLYRYAFYNGAIKVSIGDKKTLFLIEKNPPTYGWVRLYKKN